MRALSSTILIFTFCTISHGKIATTFENHISDLFVASREIVSSEADGCLTPPSPPLSSPEVEYSQESPPPSSPTECESPSPQPDDCEPTPSESSTGYLTLPSPPSVEYSPIPPLPVDYILPPPSSDCLPKLPSPPPLAIPDDNNPKVDVSNNIVPLPSISSSSGGETLFHQPAPIIIRRLPTNILINHPPMVIRPPSVIFHKPPAKIVTQKLWIPSPPPMLPPLVQLPPVQLPPLQLPPIQAPPVQLPPLQLPPIQPPPTTNCQLQLPNFDVRLLDLILSKQLIKEEDCNESFT